MVTPVIELVSKGLGHASTQSTASGYGRIGYMLAASQLTAKLFKHSFSTIPILLRITGTRSFFDVENSLSVLLKSIRRWACQHNGTEYMREFRETMQSFFLRQFITPETQYWLGLNPQFPDRSRGVLPYWVARLATLEQP